MNVDRIIQQLKKQYPDKKIIKNYNDHPTEIICEIEPSEKHPDYSIAIAVIDQSFPHYHNKTIEIYEILKGELILTQNNQETLLKKGDKITIKPKVIHSAKGKETWVKTISYPGWKFEDHILVDNHI